MYELSGRFAQREAKPPNTDPFEYRSDRTQLMYPGLLAFS